MDNSITVTSLGFAHNEAPILQDIHFEIAISTHFTFCGENGSGKSTCLKLIAGLLEPCAGTISLPNQGEFSNLIGYLGHKEGLDLSLSGYEHFNLDVSITTKFTPAEQMTHFHSWGLKTTQVDLPSANLSEGQRKRLALALLEAKDARIWLLDEPFINLDALGQARLKEAISTHCAKQGMVVVTAHLPPSVGPFYDLSSNKPC